MKSWGEQQTIEGVVCTQGFIQLDNVRQVSVYTFMTEGFGIDVGANTIPFFQETLLQQKPEAIVLTHHHEDHTGNSAFVEQQLHIPQYIHPLAVKDMHVTANNPQYRRDVWGTRPAFDALPLAETFEAKSTWDVHHTPGHAFDHVALYNRSNGHLFAGDLFVAPKIKLMLQGESYSTLLQSLRFIQTIDYGTLFCSHAGYVKNARTRIDQKIAYMEDFADEIMTLHRQGKDAEEIVAQLLPYKAVMEAISDGEWSRQYLVETVIREAPALFAYV